MFFIIGCGICIFVLDGGGICGRVMLKMLKRIEVRNYFIYLFRV